MRTIVQLGVRLVAKVSRFAGHVRRFFYDVVLSEHSCPKCSGTLRMITEGQCRCRSCGYTFDPTVAFQRCSSCGGKPRIVIRRYRCTRCGTDIASRFLFDGLIFDVEYFREKMVEYRARRKEQRERVRKMLAETRSDHVDLPGADLNAVPGLVEALDDLTAEMVSAVAWSPNAEFDLEMYQKHVWHHVETWDTDFDNIPDLIKSRRLDRIWRFIAVIFLIHKGVIDVEQQASTLLLKKNEANGEGQGSLGEIEAVG